MKKTIIAAVLLAVVILVQVVQIRTLKSQMEDIQATVQNGQTAYECIAGGVCVYDVVTRYHQYLLTQQVNEEGGN